MKAQTTLTWSIERDEASTRVLLSGYISERADFPRLRDEIPSGQLVLDLADIQRISSSGIREWIRFLDSLTERGDKFSFVRCSAAIVHQLVMIQRFRGAGQVVSVLAPYYCENCSREQSRVIDLATDIDSQLSGSEACTTCSGGMELDDLPENYLRLRT